MSIFPATEQYRSYPEGISIIYYRRRLILPTFLTDVGKAINWHALKISFIIKTKNELIIMNKYYDTTCTCIKKVLSPSILMWINAAGFFVTAWIQNKPKL